jgi:bifunctional DNase/RNase
LITAAGSRLTEVRITRLVEDVFYAVVVVQGPAGAGAGKAITDEIDTHVLGELLGRPGTDI